MTFFEYVSCKDRYNNLLTKLLGDDNYLYYRTVSHEDVVSLVEAGEFKAPRLVEIPKDNGKTRQIYVYRRRDNLVLKLLNEWLYETSGHLISDRVFSYKTGVRVGDVHKDVKKALQEFEGVGFMSIDLKDYFTNVSMDKVYALLEEVNFPKEYVPKLFTGMYYDLEGNLTEGSLGIIQGNPVASFVSNAVLKDFDDLMESRSSYYIRYSDDVVYSKDCTVNVSEALNEYGLTINEAKTKVCSESIDMVGCTMTKDSIDIKDGKFKALKRSVKNKTKAVDKLNVSGEEKCKSLMRRWYKEQVYPFVRGRNGGGSLLRFAFDHVDTKKTLWELDKYVVSRMQYLMTGKNNASAKLKGMDSDFFRQFGWVPTAEWYSIYKSSKIVYRGEVYEHICQQKRPPEVPRPDKTISLRELTTINPATVRLDYRTGIVYVGKETYTLEQGEPLTNITKEMLLGLYKSFYLASGCGRHRLETFSFIDKARLGIYSRLQESGLNQLYKFNLIIFMLCEGMVDMELKRVGNYYYLNDDVATITIHEQWMR